jgi:hypothetical protein
MIFPTQKVDAIHAGTGKIDMATDCVDLAALFRAYASKVKGNTAVTPAEIAETATLGSDLLKLLKPGTAKKMRPADVKKAADVRDRLWTLVKQGYDALWRACAYLYGEEGVAARVPALQARTATTSTRKKANAAKKKAKTAQPTA